MTIGRFRNYRELAGSRDVTRDQPYRKFRHPHIIPIKMIVIL